MAQVVGHLFPISISTTSPPKLKKLKLCTPLKATKLEKNKGESFPQRSVKKRKRKKSKEIFLFYFQRKIRREH